MRRAERSGQRPNSARVVMASVAGSVLVAGCGQATPTTEVVEPLGVDSCVVYVHGRSAAGAAPTVTDGIGELAPNGNVRFGDGFGWEYSSEEQYSGARAIIGDIIDDAECSNVVLTGFSNGAAFVAKLYCQGESFEGSVAGFVIDDPVPDTAVQECAPDPSAQVALYWTGGLADDAQPGTECAELGWTCDGDVLLGIEAYAEALGTEILESPYSDHRWFRDAPEINRWLQ